ncbi:MAG TPA: glycosyltransferase [Acidimicrobiales bacterium]|nr:glycosyltransferase [Acidimicrobiales bacterium]
MGDRITFAILGHNEATRLHFAVCQALEAAEVGDQVWFVDSGSTDDSTQRAAALGTEVIRAPVGKGRAMAVAFERCSDGHLCFIDGDMESSERNIPATLRRAVVDTDADMVVGRFTFEARRSVITPALYYPLTRALFPETRDLDILPLSGLRTVRSGLDVGAIPPGYGVEAHLNLQVGLTGGRIEGCELGVFDGPVREYANLAPAADDVVAAILDLAVRQGRLGVADRDLWQEWAAAVLTPLWRAHERGAFEAHDFESALEASTRPLPMREAR